MAHEGNGGSGLVRGVLDSIAADAKGLQDISDQQSAIMQMVGGTMDTLAVALKVTSPAGAACAAVGEKLHADGMQFSAKFADHSSMMGNNRNILETADADAMHMFNQIHGVLQA